MNLNGEYFCKLELYLIRVVMKKFQIYESIILILEEKKIDNMSTHAMAFMEGSAVAMQFFGREKIF